MTRAIIRLINVKPCNALLRNLLDGLSIYLNQSWEINFKFCIAIIRRPYLHEQGCWGSVVFGGQKEESTSKILLEHLAETMAKITQICCIRTHLLNLWERLVTAAWQSHLWRLRETVMHMQGTYLDSLRQVTVPYKCSTHAYRKNGGKWK